MTITNISYSESHESITPEGLKKWNKIGLEANVSEGEDIMECQKELKRIVGNMKIIDADQVTMNISRTTEGTYFVDAIPVKSIRIQSIIQEINNCTSLDEKNKYGQQIGLLAYEQAAKDSEEVGAAYAKRLMELKNQ